MSGMQRTRIKGVYLRGSRYVAVFYDDAGKQRKKAFRTQKEAVDFKREQEVAVSRGTYKPESALTLHEYADQWLPRHALRKNSHGDYERHLRLYVRKYFGPRVKLTELSPAKIKGFYAWLKDEGRNLGTVQKCRTVLSALLTSAVEDEHLRTNPARGVKLPKYEVPVSDDDHETHDVRVFTDEQLAVILSVVPAKHRLFFEMLAATGLRFSEAIALEWRHLELNGSRPHVKVRRACVRGEIQQPKSKAGRRDVPLPYGLVRALRGAQEAPDALVFPNDTGGYLTDGKLRRNVLQPALEEAGCSWAGFHTFRHSFASKHIVNRASIVALAKAMGHSRTSMTLDTYAHLMQGDELPALEVAIQTGNASIPTGDALSLEPAASEG